MVQEENNDRSIIVLIETVRSTWKYLLRKWYIIFLAGLIMGSLGILYAWLKKPEYIAQLTFNTESDAGSQLGMYAGLAAQFGLDLGSGTNSAFEGDNLIELLKSRNLIEKTLLSPIGDKGSELMIDNYLSNHKMKDNWDEDTSFQKVKFVSDPSSDDRVRDSILFKVYENILKGQLSVGKRDKKLNLVEINMKDENEIFSKRFVELLVSNAIQFYTEYKVKKTKQNVAILQKQTDSVRGTLFGNITQAAQMSDLNVNPIRQIVRAGTQRKQVDVQVNGVVYGELLKNLELSKIALRKETPLIQIIDTPKYPLKKKKPGRLFTGILFAIAGGVIAFLYLLIKHWFNENYSSHLKATKTKTIKIEA